jgi:hypothetical protein
MPPLLTSIDEQGTDTGKFGGVRFLPIANVFRVPGCKVDCSLVSFTDCGRLMLDLILSVVCGANTGLFVAHIRQLFSTVAASFAESSTKFPLLVDNAKAGASVGSGGFRREML